MRPGVNPASPATAPDEAAPATADQVTAPAPRAAARPVAASRYAGSVTAPRRGAGVAASTGTIDIDERVPYFAQDLRRILVTAVLMVAAIIAASLFLH